MNPQHSIHPTERNSAELEKKKGFLKVGKGKKKEINSKECIVLCKIAFLSGSEGVSWVAYLTSTDQAIPC